MALGTYGPFPLPFTDSVVEIFEEDGDPAVFYDNNNAVTSEPTITSDNDLFFRVWEGTYIVSVSRPGTPNQNSNTRVYVRSDTVQLVPAPGGALATDAEVTAAIAAERAVVNATFPTFDTTISAAVLDGVTNNTALIQAELNALSRGDTLWIPDGPCVITGQLTVPVGCRLLRSGVKGAASSFYDASLTGSSVPAGPTFLITSTTESPIVLLSNSTVEGCNFFYPNQNWDITSLAEAFVTYPPTIQLGKVGTANIGQPIMRGLSFLGATHCIGQYATDGTAIQSPIIEGIRGWVLGGSWLRLNRVNDVTHISDVHLTPNDVTRFVTAKSGDVPIFRTKAVQSSILFHLGNVDGLVVKDFFTYGCHTAVKYDTAMYTGDVNEGFSGQFLGTGVDGCHRAFHIKRGSNAFPVTVTGGWFTPIVRPNGAGTDSDEQAFMFFDGAACANVRVMIDGVRVSGGAVGEFVTNYSGQADCAFMASSPGANIRATVSGGSFHNLNTGIVHSTAAAIVSYSQATLADGAPKQSATDFAGRITSTEYVLAAGLGTSDSDPGTTPGSLVRFFRIRDGNGNSLGFVPIYSSFT